MGTDADMVECEYRLRTVTGLNAREHWAVRARRVKGERQATRAALVRYGAGFKREAGRPYTAILTRVSRRECDTDNLVGALKAVRDEVAAWLGVDDGSEAMSWLYSQERGEPGVKLMILWRRRRPGPTRRFERSEARKLMEAGASAAAAARAFGVSRQAMHKAMKAGS